MSEASKMTFEQEAREVVLKSSITGVAASAIAVTIFSPVGLGGLVGTSLASGFGFDSGTQPSDNVYANLAPYAAPLTPQELSDIRGQLARTTASLEITRAATEAKIDGLRLLAVSREVEPLRVIERAEPVTRSLPVARLAAAPTPTSAPATVIDASVGSRDRHSDLAEMMFAHENI